MAGFNGNFLRMQIAIITEREQRFKWLLDLGINANKVINFGCNIGTDTLGLMYVFDSTEGIGFDIDTQSIHQAKSTYRHIREDIQRFERMLQFYLQAVSEEDKVWWTKVPDFFKRSLFRNTFSLEYIVQDITQPSSVPSNYFDIAFSDLVLHHIWYDENSDSSLDDTFRAIQEMVRVVRPGGSVAAFELIQYANKPKLDFSTLFEKVGLQPVHVKEIKIESDSNEDVIVGEFSYTKTSKK